jgi:hypothetical protein
VKKGTRKFFLFELLGTRKSQKGTRKFPYPFQKGEQIYKKGKIYKKWKFFSGQRKVQNSTKVQFFLKHTEYLRWFVFTGMNIELTEPRPINLVVRHIIVLFIGLLLNMK